MCVVTETERDSENQQVSRRSATPVGVRANFRYLGKCPDKVTVRADCAIVGRVGTLPGQVQAATADRS